MCVYIILADYTFRCSVKHYCKLMLVCLEKCCAIKNAKKKKVNRSYFFLFKWKVYLAPSIPCTVSGPARIPTASGKKQPFEADVSKQVDFMTFSLPSSYWLTAPAFFPIASSLLPQSSLTLWRRRRNVVMGRVASLLQVLLLGWLRRACCVDLTCRLSKRIISLAAPPKYTAWVSEVQAVSS